MFSAQMQFPLNDGNKVLAVNNDANAISLLALESIRGVGFMTARALYDALEGDLTRVWITDGDTLFDYVRRAQTPQPSQVVEQILRRGKALLTMAEDRYRFMKASNTSVLFRGLEGYPPRLYSLPDAPAWLFVQGDTSILDLPTIIAVVGTRHPTSEGLEAAKRIAILLAKNDCVVLSGLAEGIDAVGHRTAIDYGAPTIAVLGHGIDVVFPSATADLRQQMIERGGAVVSEYLPGDSYARDRFVARNRIQAALSTAVGIVEGQVKSGTAHTLRFARSLNRSVFGVRIGAEKAISQQEILSAIQKAGDPVFDLDRPTDREKFRGFLMDVTGGVAGSGQSGSRLFRGLVADFERLASDYDADDDDYSWLVEQIIKVRKERIAKDAN